MKKLIKLSKTDKAKQLMRNGVMDKDVLRYLLGLAHLSCQGVIRFLEPRRVSAL